MPSLRHQTPGLVLKDGEVDFRFTIFCGRTKNKWGRMLASNPWRCMELELKDDRLAEARAFLAQGRDFFTAAADSGWTSRPLLLYYGFLNLAKTLIKVRNPRLNLTGAFHGLNETRENQAAQRFRLTSQSVTIQDPRRNRAHILNEFARAIEWAPLTAGARYEICDLLAQVPPVHRAYSHTRDLPERLHAIRDAQFVIDQNKKRIWARVWIRKGGASLSRAIAQLRSRQYFKAFFSQRELDPNDSKHKKLALFETRQIAYSGNPRSALRELGIRCIKAGVTEILTSSGYRYYLSDTQPAVRVHDSLAAYMAMFYFGSVARYRPTHLEKILKSNFAWTSWSGFGIIITIATVTPNSFAFSADGGLTVLTRTPPRFSV